MLADGLSENEEILLRTSTYTGRPLGSVEFIERIEAQAGRPLTPQKRGRKPKAAGEPTTEADLFK